VDGALHGRLDDDGCAGAMGHELDVEVAGFACWMEGAEKEGGAAPWGMEQSGGCAASSL